MSSSQKIAEEQSSAAHSTQINDLAPGQDELSLDALSGVVGQGDTIRGGTIVVKGGCKGTVDHEAKSCD